MQNKCFMCGKLREEFDRLTDERMRYAAHIAVTFLYNKKGST